MTTAVQSLYIKYSEWGITHTPRDSSMLARVFAFCGLDMVFAGCLVVCCGGLWEKGAELISCMVILTSRNCLDGSVLSQRSISSLAQLEKQGQYN
jgi:hypothetical protein